MKIKRRKIGSEFYLRFWRRGFRPCSFVLLLCFVVAGVVSAHAMDRSGSPAAATAAGATASAKQQSFERVFGVAARLDPAMVRKVKADAPGRRHYVDRDGDGKPEEVWFIDIHPRHHNQNRPLLVRVIDEDGDLVAGGEPDRDSDLYVADWHADGAVDAVIDYEDLDGDQDMDRMGMYSYDERIGLRVSLRIDAAGGLVLRGFARGVCAGFSCRTVAKVSFGPGAGCGAG